MRHISLAHKRSLLQGKRESESSVLFYTNITRQSPISPEKAGRINAYGHDSCCFFLIALIPTEWEPAIGYRTVTFVSQGIYGPRMLGSWLVPARWDWDHISKEGASKVLPLICLNVFEYEEPGPIDWESGWVLHRRSRSALSPAPLDALQYRICANLKDFKT